MSADNGIWILKDMENNCVVVEDNMSFLTCLIESPNPWIGCKDESKIMPMIAGKRILPLKRAVETAEMMLKKMEICEYGISVIPIQNLFADVKVVHTQKLLKELEKSLQREHKDRVWLKQLENNHLAEYTLCPKGYSYKEWKLAFYYGLKRADKDKSLKEKDYNKMANWYQNNF